MSRRRHISILPQTQFKVSPVGIQFTYNRPSEILFPLPWCSQVLVWHHCHHVLASSETRQSRPLLFFFFFPSWMHLLDGEDNFMLSVPLSTSDLHYSCWQSGENCQVVSAGAFTLLCHAFWFSLKGLLLSLFLLFVLSCCLANVLPAPRFPTFRPDTASFLSCL